MTSIDIHGVRTISARSNLSDDGKYSWLTLMVNDIEITMFMPATTAEIYAAAIRGVTIESVVTEQEAA